MKKWGFKQWYAVIFLAVFIIYGWLYLLNGRYEAGQGCILDKWAGKAYFSIAEFNER